MSDKLAVIQTEESIKELRKLRAELPGLISDVRELSTSVNNFNRNLRSNNLRNYTEAMQNATNVSRQFSDIQRRVSVEMERLSRVERNNAQAAEANARARRENATAAREEGRVREQVARTAAREARQNDESSSAYKRLKKEVRDATGRARDYGAEIIDLQRKKRAGTITTEEYRRKMKDLSKDFRNSTKEALALQKELDKLNRATSAHQQKNGSLQGRVTDVLKAMGISSIIDNVASSFYRFGEKAIETSAKLDTLRLSQKAVFKTSEEVNLQNEFLTKTANRYGIEILGLSDAYTKFAASAQGTYLEGKRTQDVFDAVSRSSALLGVSSDETSGILRALGQMMSKGKVQAEELRGQLGDRMAGAFKLFADGMGVSTSQLDAMLKKGEVLADDVLPKFAAQLNKKYTLGIGEAIETQTAATNRASNAWVAFVDGVNSGSGVMTKSVIGFSSALTSMLEALTPSKKVTIIEQEQSQLNILGMELRKNFSDEKKRKEILDEMIKINPFFINGLDREKLTLADINKQLQNVNQQYAQKIALEMQGEKIEALNKDLAQSYIYLSKVYSDNAVEYNNFNAATRKALDDFRDGLIDYSKAKSIIQKNTKDFSTENDVAVEMLRRLNTVINQSSLNFDGFTRGIRGTEAQLKTASAEANNMVNVFERMAKVQKQLVFMNGMTATTYNSLGKAQQDDWKVFAEGAEKATLQGDKFFLHKNQWRAMNSKGNWFSTGKKGEDWFLEDGKLVQRKKAELLKKEEKEKAASLTAAQKDQMNILQAERDNALAIITQQQNERLINEQQFQEKRIEIIRNYSDKVQAYLKGNNAKEKQVEASVFLRATNEIKGSMKEQYDYYKKESDQIYQKKQNSLDRQSKEFEAADFFSNGERINKQIAIDNQQIEEAEKYYLEQISLAVEFNQDVLEWERKRDEEIGKIEDARAEKRRSLFEAYKADLEKQTEFLSVSENLSFEEQKSLILSDKKLSNAQREYRLMLLEIDTQIAMNNLKIKELQLMKDQYALKVSASTLPFGIVNPEDVKNLKELEGQITSLQNANVELNNQAKDAISEQTQAIRDSIASGFQTLGFDHLADAYTATMERLKNKTAEWKDYAVLAVTAVLESLSSLNNAQKEKTIANLDEQLKHSQETTEQELKFIDDRLSALNNLDELTKEQQEERNKLEDEARGMKEQQRMREKMIETQKARAEQRAASQQALINGALAATQSLAQYGFTPAGLIAAALAVGFGVAQSIAISSKDPVPQYWKGRERGPAEYAWTQERGREIITDKHGNIKDLGTDKGAKMTYLDKDDKVLTAEKSKAYLRQLKEMPKIGNNVFRNIAFASLKAPSFNVMINNKSEDYSQKIVDGLAQKIDSIMSRNSNPDYQKANGKIIKYHGNRIPKTVGEYDLITGKETWYQ